jgi:two-component sensor histidine kinase
MFQESESRIKSMALIHEQLYQSEKLAHIDFAEYVTRLTNHLSRSYNSRHIGLHLNIEQLFLTVETAIPCGLIINELVTNAFKYAFPNRQTGQIEVRMEADEQNQLTLSGKDNGIGFPKEINTRRPKSLGLTLVTTLTKQLHGTIDVRSEGGTEFELTFSDPSAKKGER